MPTPYEPVIASADAEAARELILDLLEKFPRGLNAKEIGLQLDYSGYSISHIIRPLTASGKVKKDSAGKNKGVYSLNKEVKPATTPVAKSTKVPKASSRHLLVYKDLSGKWVAEIELSEQAAMDKGAKISEDNPENTIFYGKATARITTPKPKTKVEKL